MGFTFDLPIRPKPELNQTIECDDDAVVRDIPEHLRLLNIPLEVRYMIYSYCIENEQEDLREYVGNHSNASRSDLCTPLFKVRPPALIRVCKQAREEYLPIYLRETCFRVYVNVDEVDRGPLETDRITIDSATESWLRSIVREDKNLYFRHLQFRLTHNGGVPVGASFNLTFNAQRKKYRVDFIMDAGWMPLQYSSLGGYTQLYVKEMPHRAWEHVQAISEKAGAEWMNWGQVQMLQHKLTARSIVDFNWRVSLHAYPELKDWSDETAQVSTVSEESRLPRVSYLSKGSSGWQV